MKSFPTMEEKGFTSAKVISYNVDGCTWMIILKDGTQLQPLNLQPEFQKNDLEIWIKYEIKKGAVGICMAGEIINIKEIEVKKNE